MDELYEELIQGLMRIRGVINSDTHSPAEDTFDLLDVTATIRRLRNKRNERIRNVSE